jgi:hypothetical protein
MNVNEIMWETDGGPLSFFPLQKWSFQLALTAALLEAS